METLQALKLAERTIQFADTMAVLTDGYIRAGRVCHAEGSYSDSLKHYKQAAEGQTNNVLAAIGFAQMQLRNGTLRFSYYSPPCLLINRRRDGGRHSYP
jgi:RNA polymerase-associated protein CTR9